MTHFDVFLAVVAGNVYFWGVVWLWKRWRQEENNLRDKILTNVAIAMGLGLPFVIVFLT